MNVLEQCYVNDVLGVTYGDKPEERVVRVLNKRDLEQRPLAPRTQARRPHVNRGRFLVTCQDTHGQIRSFYSGVETSARRIPVLKAAILRLKGQLPPRKRS